ncbi:MAG: TadE/TadG family type IV pilus assembly protein [Bryobacteraceae bacterium]
MTSRQPPAPRGRKGQAMVEASLVMLVFLAVFIGILDFGQVMYFHQALTERARAAARYAAVNVYTDPGNDTKRVAVFNRPDPPEGTAPIVAGLTIAMVTVTLSGAAGDPNAHIRVDIANFPVTFFTPGLAKIMNARVRVTMPYEVPAAP